MTGGRGHLLVVDDNEMNRDVLARRLERQGHTVVSAQNGREALELLHRESFDLVLLDIMMPEVNGYEVLERMKSDPALRHIPVIMISAVGEMDSVVQCIEMGAEDYLPKPFSPVLLKARLGASLEKKWLRDRDREQLAHSEAERSRIDALLGAVLPADMLAALRNEASSLRNLASVAVLAFDGVFPPGTDTPELAAQRDAAFAAHGLETVVTVDGRTFGMSEGPDAAGHCLSAARALLAAPGGALLRAGIHVGPAMAITFANRALLVGATVAAATRLAALGAPGTAYASAAAHQALTGSTPAGHAAATLAGVSPLDGFELYRIE
jgi:adenylate cyclase